MARGRRVTVTALAAALVAFAVASSLATPGSAAGTSSDRTAGAAMRSTPIKVSRTLPQAARLTRPNVVFILADDLDYSLLKRMPNLLAMQRSGASFTNSFVVDSLCCSSRASTFTGMYPHNSKVLGNTTGPDKAHPIGGWKAYLAAGDNEKSFAYALSRRAQQRYRTALMGKFLNRYQGTAGSAVPAGWSDFNAITTNGYANWNYVMTQAATSNGRRVITRKRFGTKPKDYSTTVLQRRAVKYVAAARSSSTPYFLEVATYATHRRTSKAAHKGDPAFPPAFQDRPGHSARRAGNCGTTGCKKLKVRNLPGYNDNTADNTPRYADGRLAPAWNTNTPITTAARAKLNGLYRSRAQMAQSLDRLIGSVRRSVGPHTYVVVSSDNGYHLGQHRMGIGKGTAYGHDIRVPLIVSGPGVVPGPRSQVVTNVDLASTFEQIAGTPPGAGRDGESILPYLRNPTAPGARYAFIEHTRQRASANDPDSEASIARVPSYIAVRSADALLVRYDTADGNPAGYTYEFYRGLSRSGGYERTNTYSPSDPLVQQLDAKLLQFDGCAGVACRAAIG